MRPAAVRHSLHRRYAPAFEIKWQREATEKRIAVNQHGTRRAFAQFATVLRAGEAEVFTQHLEQRLVRRHKHLYRLAVDKQFHRNPVARHALTLRSPGCRAAHGSLERKARKVDHETLPARAFGRDQRQANALLGRDLGPRAAIDGKPQLTGGIPLAELDQHHDPGLDPANLGVGPALSARSLSGGQVIEPLAKPAGGRLLVSSPHLSNRPE